MVDLKKQIFRLWGPAITVLLIPFILINLNVYQFTKRIEADAKEQFLAETKRSATFITSIIDESILDTDYLLLTPDIQSLKSISRNRTVSDYTKISTATTLIRSVLNTNTNYHVGIYFNRSQLLIANSTIYLDVEQIYGTLFHFLDFSLDEFIRYSNSNTYKLNFHPIGTSNFTTEDVEGIVYSRPIAIYNDDLYGGAGYVNLKKEFWDESLPYASIDGVYNLVMSEDDILYTTSQLPNNFDTTSYSFADLHGLIDDEIDSKYIGAYTKTKHGLTIVSFQKKETLLYPISPLIRLVWSLNILSIILIVFVILNIILNISKKIKSTASLLGEIDTSFSSDVFVTLNEAILNIKNRSEHLSREQQEHQVLLEDIFWDRALHNINSETQDELAVRSGIVLPGDSNYSLILIRLNNLSDSDSYKSLNDTYLYREQLISELKKICSAYPVGIDQIVLLLPISNMEFYQYEVNSFTKTIPEISGFSIRFASSQPFKNMSGLYQYYLACKESNDTTARLSKQLNWAQIDQITNRDYIYFPFELEVQIGNAIKRGDSDLLRTKYREILHENLINRTLSHEMLGLLQAKLKLLFVAVYDETMPRSLADYLQTINDSSSESSVFSDSYHLLNEMCMFYSERLADRQNHQFVIFENYMNENFSDQNLSIKSAASHFGYSESYFSRMFKEVIGCSFSSYLEKIRLHAADDLLVDSNLSIEEVAISVGYSSSNSFRRAYSRLYSITPSQRRSEF